MTIEQSAEESESSPALVAEALRLGVEDLYRPCEPASLGFQTTDELPDLEEVIGQPRAVRAFELGSEAEGSGFNIFVLGLPGSGRSTLSKEHLERKARAEPPPPDWCYLFNFENPHAPRALQLAAGKGSQFRQQLKELIERCRVDLPRLFQSEEYTQARERLAEALKKEQEAELTRLKEHVERFNFVIARTPFGFLLAPTIQGKPISPEELEKLSPEQREKLNELQERLGEDVERTLKRLRDMEQEANEKLQELNVRTALFLLDPLIGALQTQYNEVEDIVRHLEAIKADMVKNLGGFIPAPAGAPEQPVAGRPEADWFKRYEVNLLVDNAALQGAPVVVENHPSYANLLGRIEHEYVMGASRTDFTMIRPGAFHRANGGYLILPARDVLLNPYAWEGMKRVLREGAIRMIELSAQLGLTSTATLEPEPIPLDVKVVLIGTPMLYYLLRSYDEDFAKLFKVRAEFAASMERTPENERDYGLFVRSVVMENKLAAFDASAVAQIIEYSSRLAENQQKLSTRFGKIADLVVEASYWAGKEKRSIVTVAEVKRAIEESIYRSNLVEERVQEAIAEGTLMIDVEGQRVGQVNALSVLSLGDYAFGKPTRLTASAYLGRGGVVDIERQAKLGGPIHTKGVLIISGFLGNCYGQSRPLNLSASLTFEQSYDEIEGDSASAAELFALLSAISRLPLRQDIAVTGSVNQHGQIQAIGGVNEKIEGFFEVCRARGLTGRQGVIIPHANRRNLMLRQEVIDAVREGLFHIWAIRHVNEGLELLTGLPAGEKGEDGAYPEGCFNAEVAKRLDEFVKALEPTAKEPKTAAEQEN